MTTSACNIAPSEATARERTAFVVLAILLMTASFMLVKTGRDALYFQERGLFDLPKAYIGIAVMSVPFAFITLGMMRAVGPRAARIIAPLVVAGSFAVAVVYATPGGGLFNTALFIAIPLSFGVLFSLSWLLAADLLDGLPGERLARFYGVIGAGSIIGGMLGALAAKLVAAHITPRMLLWIGCGVLTASALTMLVAQNRYPPRQISTPARTKDLSAGGGVLDVMRHRYVGLLLVVAMTASLTGIFIEFQFYLAAATSNNSGQQNVRFFANFYLLLNGGALLVQLYVMPRLQRLVGVGGSLLIMPVAILGGAAALAGYATPLMRSGLKLAEGGLKASVHRSNWEQAFLPVSSERRAAAKLIIDGAAARVAEGLAAVALYIWLLSAVGDGSLAGRSTSWLTYVIIVTALAWVGLTWLLRRGVDEHARGADEAFRADIPLPDT